MRILYVLAHFPQGSESYVEAELAYFLARGVQIEVWSPTSGYGDPPKVPVRRGSLKEALDTFRPDAVHIHHMTTASYYVDQLPKGSVTVRAHSFDWDAALVSKLVAHSAVRRVFAFPHLAGRVPGVVPMPVAYDPSLYYPCPKDRNSVVRLSAGLPTKRLEDFLVVGNRMFALANFTLAVNLVVGKEAKTVDALSAANDALGGHVHIQANLSRAAASKLVREAAVYLSTYDAASHPFGMPISIAEALATGAIVLARRAGPEVSGYLGEATLTYDSVDEAVDRIRTVLALPDDEWEYRREVCVRSALRFQSDIVLPRLEEEWKAICSDNF